MALTLTSQDVAELERSLTTLLSPLDSPTLDHWRVGVTRSVRTLLCADKAAFILPIPDFVPVLGDGIEPQALDAYLTYFAEQDEGMRRQKELGLEVWSVMDLLDAHSHHRTEIWNEWKAPNGLLGATGISVEVEGMPAGLMCYDEREDPHTEERQTILLRLLRSAFVAGVRTFQRIGEHRASLAESVDVLGDAVALYDLRSQLLHANPALLRLLDREPDTEQLLEAMQQRACALVQHATHGTKAQPSRIPGMALAEVKVGGHYRVTGTYLGSDLGGHGVMVLVTVATLQPPLPSEQVLRARFGLTRKESIVALHLAREKSNEQIASALFISPHTARHHTENIFLKLGVHSRAELIRAIHALA